MNYQIFLLIIIFTLIIGLWSTYQYIIEKKIKDPPEVVIDEVAGQWITVIPLFMFQNTNITNSWQSQLFFWGIAFFLFRVFDIVKPWPINKADARNDAFGVMLDDTIAGAASAIILFFLLIFVEFYYG